MKWTIVVVVVVVVVVAGVVVHNSLYQMKVNICTHNQFRVVKLMKDSHK